ncbi:plasmid mobilization protein [Burkholderia territorii]|uniref:plasmid mobilization protein n=1 Tax=Burkholderia territorii TaxID=1503055 RepID=UPI0039BFE83B
MDAKTHLRTNADVAEVPRRRHQPIRVWCLPDEKARIEANARNASLSVSCYLRDVRMGYKIQGVIDAELVRLLAKINGDQGRLGGLLKLWLTNDSRLGRDQPEQLRRVILGGTGLHCPLAGSNARAGEEGLIVAGRYGAAYR